MRGETPRPWAVGCNRFAVKSHDRQHTSLRRRRSTPQPRVSRVSRHRCVEWSAAPDVSLRRRRCTTQPRVTRVSRRTLSPGHQHASYAAGVTPHSPGSAAFRGAPWETNRATMCPYAAGVAQHSPGSPRSRHPGSRTATCVLTPQALHPTAQGQPRFAADPGKRTGPRYVLTPKALHNTAQGQPRFAAHPGSRTPTCVLTPQAFDPTAQGQPRFAAHPGKRNGHDCPYAEGVTYHSPGSAAFRGAPWVTFDNRANDTPKGFHK